MSLPVFALDGTPSDTWGIFLPKKTLSLLPPTRDVEVTIPGRPGVLDYRTEFDKREIKLELLAKAKNKTELMTNLRAFSKAISPTVGYRSIVFEDEPDKEYRVKITGQSEIEFGPWWAKFELTLKMADPFIYALADSVATFTVTGGDNVTLTNPGTVDTGMLIDLSPVSGALVNPTISGNGATFMWRGTISSGQTLHIDTQNLSVLLDNTNALSGWNGDWPKLLPGDNQLSYTGEQAQMTVTFRPKWI